jgi:alpha-tubulin suppressor-like RCC1 family protein
MSLTADGRVRVWGDTGNFYNVTNVPVNMTNVLAVSAGDEQCLALQADGKVIAWGYDAGYGATTLPPGLVSASSVSAGFDHNIAVVANGNAIPTSKGLMQNAALDSGLFSALLPSQSGHVYALQYRKSLDDTNWFSLPLVPGNGTIK